MKILIFISLIMLGIICVRYSKWITDNTTRFEWPERTFGPGGTYSAWKILGVLIIIFAFYYLIGL
ncbi:hypothetical protein A2215_02880 [Candidatus Berkelbacteria bacterium RIFOXYA2_FULL_43_10]|uniref:Uncharacterized protein n=1 Tax=Candidatus Berkelbacteria bacterium RIFOXYA2_FULL_43_10 TaxID=1797472 RepID=A0A1F5E4R6_9BACT|nr:MAG: hypothetical protein A2215_02880 [Candidatus Berkelbacteria bacterium RIFOXYA2_FULL_43_10]